VKRAKAEELAPAGSPDQEAVGLVRLLAGQENGARQDAVCLNTAPIFLLARRVQDFKAGVEFHLFRKRVGEAQRVGELPEYETRNRNRKA
jgi:anthranilate phosphoribosyltransferase